MSVFEHIKIFILRCPAMYGILHIQVIIPLVRVLESHLCDNGNHRWPNVTSSIHASALCATLNLFAPWMNILCSIRRRIRLNRFPGLRCSLISTLLLNWRLHPIHRCSPAGDSDRLVCLEDGLWSFPEAYCKIECAEVPNVPNAKLLTADCAASGHDVGTVCRYKCSTGFYVAGSLKRKTPK